jgi:hypothetical protein
MAQGNLADALTSYQADLDIMKRLAGSDPSNAGWQDDLSISFERLGDVQMAQGNLGDAQVSYETKLAIVQGVRFGTDRHCLSKNLLRYSSSVSRLSLTRFGQLRSCQPRRPEHWSPFEHVPAKRASSA